MILGIGIDIVEIERFALWHTYSQKKLSRIFSHEEITYCKAQHRISAQRFAARFAAREAVYKAFSQAYPGHSVPFLTFCRASSISQTASVPHFVVDWQLLNLPNFFQWHVLISISHTAQLATAMAMVQDRPAL